MGHDLRQAHPTGLGRRQRVVDDRPFLGLQVVAQHLGVVFRIVAPFALHGHVEHVAHAGDPLEAEATLDREKLGRQGDVVLDRAVAAHVEDRVRHKLVGPAFGRDPEAALAVKRDAFHVHQLRGLASRVTRMASTMRAGVSETSMWKIVGCMA
jgi:hypothetical protein